jgi:hypothetical protein
MALTYFEPDAAYVKFSRKIKEARESLRQASGVRGYVTPYLSIATLCDNILHESDGVFSLIRLADVYHFASDPQLPVPNMALLLKGLLQFRGGPETFDVTILVIGPREEHLFSASAPIALNGGTHSLTLKMEFPIAVSSEGLYRLEVYRADEQLARLPFQIRRGEHQPTPPPNQPSQS